MNNFGISEKTYSLLLNTFEKFPEIREVLLFGSRAKGNYKNGSDLDLAVNGKELDPRIVFKLKSILNERLPIPCGVDVVGYDYLTHRGLKEHISRVGKVIFTRDL